MRVLTMAAAGLAMLVVSRQSTPANEVDHIAFDFSGMNQFWHITDLAAANVEPAEEQWQALFNTTAYRYLVEVNRRAPVFRKYLPLAFMPSKRAELDEALSDGSYASAQYLQHFLQARSKKDELIAFQRQLERQDVLRQSLERAAQYLPRDVVKAYPPPTVSFAIFEPDAFGDSAFGIVIDLLYARRVNLVNLIGHEAHHYYVQKTSPLQGVTQNGDDYYLVHAVDQLRLEGVADWIDKADALDPTADGQSPERRKARIEYRRVYRQSAERFAQIDSLVAQIADDPGRLKENARKVWDLLPSGGHPQGSFMSRTIVAEFGRRKLIDGMTNPFSFVRLYNQAAARATKDRKPGSYMFSEKTMSVLRRIEAAHVR